MIQVPRTSIQVNPNNKQRGRKNRPMKNIKNLIVICVLGMGFGAKAPALASQEEQPAARKDQPAAYLNAKLPIEQRIEDLLGRMTLEEKIGQLMMRASSGCMKDRTESVTDNADLIKALSQKDPKSIIADVLQGRVGTIHHVETLKDANAFQRIARQSRLGIPVLMCVNGNGWTAEDTTIFPAPLSQASTFDPAVAEAIGRATGIETRATGLNWNEAPTVDVARDPRWGRMGETFGEDVLLVSDMSEAAVRGMQTRTPEGWVTVAATAKHLVGGGQSVDGFNNRPFVLNEWELRTHFLPPFERCVKAGLLMIMAAHNETLGIPCHSSRYLLTQILRGEWGFEGAVSSDWGVMNSLVTFYHVVPDMKGAMAAAMNAGVDVYMIGTQYAEPLQAAIQAGAVDPKLIDQAVRRILRVKFLVGLFDQPLADPARMKEILRCTAHRQVALEAARKGIVLLKNRKDLLPLEQPRRILVTGPNAANAAMLGDWVLKPHQANAITVLRGLREQAPAGTTITHIDSGESYSITDDAIAGAVKAARDCDVVVAVVGDMPLRGHDRRTSGENCDRIQLNLPGRQDDLLRALYATGKPVVVVLINGRALCVKEHVDKAAALLEAWEPGESGGQAIAEILYGKVNPSGRLPVTIPRMEGQIPIVYNCKIRNPHAPLYWFGDGLSYTTFNYSNLRVPAKLEANQPLKVEVTVTNTGKRAGDEVVQVYTHQLVCSTIPPNKELKGYTRVSLQPGESKEVTVEIPFDRLANWNPALKHVVEAGDFDLMVGSSKARFSVAQTVEVK